ncbi:hypothetical protein LSAT2_024650 [Lamellibrachia satsuma]|nr:hypothetical protein LSAT2_024650 [Lamellibrachia satsuma]
MLATSHCPAVVPVPSTHPSCGPRAYPSLARGYGPETSGPGRAGPGPNIQVENACDHCAPLISKELQVTSN